MRCPSTSPLARAYPWGSQALRGQKQCARAVVAIGKPDSTFWRASIGFYISHIMPVLARFSIRGRTPGNPFRMIIPTWKRLRTNKQVSDLIEQSFGPCALKSFLLGGLVVFEADRFSVWKDVLQ